MAGVTRGSVMDALAAGAPVFLVEEQANPSTDYFVLPLCTGGSRRVRRCTFSEIPPAADLAGAVVVFVRYLPAGWRRRIEQVRPRLAGLAYFLDDDLLDAAAMAGMPWRYRYKLYTLATRHRGWLRQQRAQLWVSTPWLARKYTAWQPLQVGPRQLAPLQAVRRVFYHGSASHEAEIRWLRPVMEQVLRADDNIVFEIIGGEGTNRLYRGLPRVTVVHPMKWFAYQAFMDLEGRHIGLVPLLDLPFNQARSHTKFLDITRSGAVGIYTEGTVYGEVVRDAIDGRVVPLQAQAWVDAILQLGRDEEQRLWMLRNARAALSSG